MKLDLGAGDTHHPGFLRVGLHPDHDVICDLRSLPLLDNYADEAQAIHVIEHFYVWEVVPMLVEWRRVIKPGGLLAIECPDLYKCCQNFVRDWGDNPRHSLYGIYGDHRYRDPLMLHKHGWTYDTLAPLLKEAGFTKVREKTPKYHASRTGRDMRLEARA